MKKLLVGPRKKGEARLSRNMYQKGKGETPFTQLKIGEPGTAPRMSLTPGGCEKRKRAKLSLSAKRTFGGRKRRD